MASKTGTEAIEGYVSRIDEEYLLAQYQTMQTSDRHTDRIKRIEDFKRIVRGDWLVTKADGSTEVSKPLIENLAKNALYDISGLAHEAHSSVKFPSRGPKQEDAISARLKEAAADTTYEEGRGRRMERHAYMDLIGAGNAIVACAFSDESDYPTFTRLDPDKCFPDTRNGILQDLLYVERIKRRAVARMFPGKGFDDVAPTDKSDAVLVEYYDEHEVVRAIISEKNRGQRAVIVDRWEHKLKCVPVAYVEVDSFDGAIRGMLDQTEGGLTARNTIMKMLMDYIESMAHASFEERGIENWSTLPGPFTVYHHDTTMEGETFMRRIPPAAPANAVQTIIQYLERESSGEAIQPPGRQGQLPQSQATGTFVTSTLGRLTTAVQELQELVADLRRQITYVCFEIDEKWLDYQKDLVRSVGKKTSYLPSRDIGDDYRCKVQFGAMTGLNKMQSDQRILTHLGARLIDLGTAREQIDYLDDPTTIQDKIDREATAQALFQRMEADPSTPVATLAKLYLSQADGKSFVDALREVQPELFAAQQAAQAAGQPQLPAGAPAPSPEEQALSLEKGGGGGAPGQGVAPQFTPYPVEQIVARGR